jgi:hypothetical protein
LFFSAIFAISAVRKIKPIFLATPRDVIRHRAALYNGKIASHD